MSGLVKCPRCEDWVHNDGTPVKTPQCSLCDGSRQIPTELEAAFRLAGATGRVEWKTIKEIRKALSV